jgi:hypothetical protein
METLRTHKSQSHEAETPRALKGLSSARHNLIRKNITFTKINDMQVKEEISNIVDTLPEEFLKELLQYLKKIEQASKSQVKLSLNLNSILVEDKDVLAKLAK